MGNDGVMQVTTMPPNSGEYTSRWVELRDLAGKLQGKWDPEAGILEIQRQGAKTWYRLVRACDGDSRSSL